MHGRAARLKATRRGALMQISKPWTGAAAMCALLLSMPAYAEEPAAVPGKSAGDFLVRLRGIAVVPRDHADIDPIGGDVEIDNTGCRRSTSPTSSPTTSRWN